jgi:transcriptional regulator with XRE-family HTH domain
MKFGQNVNRLKNIGNFSMSELERFTGVSRRTLGRILAHRKSKAGEYTPTAQTVEKIATVLQVPADYVTKYKLDISPPQAV